MNLPKDWSKKPDWLDKAKEPSEIDTKGHLGIWLLVAVVVTTCGLAVLFLSRFL